MGQCHVDVEYLELWKCNQRHRNRILWCAPPMPWLALPLAGMDSLQAAQMQLIFPADFRTGHYRLALSFSKNLENLSAATALYVAFSNFCRVHSTLRVTPAMELGLTDRV